MPSGRLAKAASGVNLVKRSRNQSTHMDPLPRPILLDSAHFTPHGRRLLAALGAIDEDPLRVEAERWLAKHQGAKTPAVRAVRAALGSPVPDEWIEAAARMRSTPWKGPIA